MALIALRNSKFCFLLVERKYCFNGLRDVNYTMWNSLELLGIWIMITWHTYTGCEMLKYIIILGLVQTKRLQLKQSPYSTPLLVLEGVWTVSLHNRHLLQLLPRHPKISSRLLPLGLGSLLQGLAHRARIANHKESLFLVQTPILLLRRHKRYF